MFRKISFAIIALAILTVAYIGFNKLNYWERSAWIFKSGSGAMGFEGRGRGRFEGRLPDNRMSPEGRMTDTRMRPERRMQEVPYASGRRIPPERGQEFRRPENPGEGQGRGRQRQSPDSLRNNAMRDGERLMREGRGGEMQRFERGGRGGYNGRQKVRLGSVAWFLAVFAGFTVITLYADKLVCLLRKNNNR